MFLNTRSFLVLMFIFLSLNALSQENSDDYSVHINKVSELFPKQAIGVDVSHHQGEIDWKNVHSLNVAFVYCKATEGIDYTDPTFIRNWQELEKNGIPRGAYHMFRPEDSSEEQAMNFLMNLKIAGYNRNSLPPVLDIERVSSIKKVPHGELHERAVKWLKLVENELGVKPIVYTGPTFWENYLTDVHEITKYPLWIAEYDFGSSSPKTTAGWKRWTFWQFSERGVVPGVEKKLDFSVYFSTPEHMRKIIQYP